MVTRVLRRHALGAPHIILPIPIIAMTAAASPVSVEHNKVIVLWHILLETIMLAEERNELLTRPVIPKLLRSHALALQHHLK